MRGKYGRSRQATDENVIRRMRFACWINKAIMQTHSVAHQLSMIEVCQLYCLGLLYLSQNATVEKFVISIVDKT